MRLIFKYYWKPNLFKNKHNEIIKRSLYHIRNKNCIVHLSTPNKKQFQIKAFYFIIWFSYGGKAKK